MLHEYRTCDCCRFWQREGDHTGECRKNAPMPENKEMTSAWWPMVNDDDWCGEFTPINH